jgi:hypothetical protein
VVAVQSMTKKEVMREAIECLCCNVDKDVSKMYACLYVACRSLGQRRSLGSIFAKWKSIQQLNRHLNNRFIRTTVPNSMLAIRITNPTRKQLA